MWVRSQDKTRLLNTNYVRKNGNVIEALHSDMLCTLIGEYSTEEKALKVLDMIHENICKVEAFKTIHNYQKRNDFIFEMPQDSEVD